jgi:hypothetical protein
MSGVVGTPALAPDCSPTAIPLAAKSDRLETARGEMRAEAAREQDRFAKEFNLSGLAGAGGFEPPYGGIKS